jgi:hypothetical protein
MENLIYKKLLEFGAHNIYIFPLTADVHFRTEVVLFSKRIPYSLPTTGL